jgi:hypothetical protein
MPAIGHLARQWSTKRDSTGIFRRAIAGDHLDTRMGLEPVCKRRGRAVGQKIEGLALFEINQQRSIVSPLA